MPADPIVTPVAPVNRVPVMVTLVPPTVGPLIGLMAVTVGAATKVYRVLAALVPFGVVTRTLAGPAPPAGVMQVMEVSVSGGLGRSAVQAAPPIVTALAPVRLVPVMVTAERPAVGPLAGLMAVIVGGGI